MHPIKLSENGKALISTSHGLTLAVWLRGLWVAVPNAGILPVHSETITRFINERNDNAGWLLRIGLSSILPVDLTNKAKPQVGSTNPEELDTFTRAYIEAALWSSSDDTDRPLDERFGREDIHASTLLTMIGDCAAFQRDHADLLADIEPAQAGHDFWLTRNGHGAGFWDRDLGEVGEQLTKASDQYPAIDLYVGDDGLVHA